MKKIGDETKKWIREAVKKGYTDKEINGLLLQNGYGVLDIKNCLVEAKNFVGEVEDKKIQEESEEMMQRSEEGKQNLLNTFTPSKLSKDSLVRQTNVSLVEPIENNGGVKYVDSKIIEPKGVRKFSSLLQLKKPVRDSELSHNVREIAMKLQQVREEMGKALIGQKEAVDAILCAILCNGHVLLEGVPGIAKTLMVRALADASGCMSKRIQFTVDLLPSDITGITTYTPERGFETIKGPVFANFLLADEINRSPPKTQSALIESMQEKQVTIAKETYKLPQPFFVMATENPLESSGVYDLPEAQVDRFLFKLIVGYPTKSSEEKAIMDNNMTLSKFEDFGIKAVLNPKILLTMQEITKKIYVDERIKDYIVKIVKKTRTKDFQYGEYVEWGGSPRATIGLFIASKAWALMQGREYVIPDDVKKISHYVLRHRIILNYKARAEGLDSDKVIDEILRIVSV